MSVGSEATYGFDASKYLTGQQNSTLTTKDQWVKLDKYCVPPTQNLKFEKFITLAFKSQMPASEIQS